MTFKFNETNGKVFRYKDSKIEYLNVTVQPTFADIFFHFLSLSKKKKMLKGNTATKVRSTSLFWQ